VRCVARWLTIGLLVAVGSVLLASAAAAHPTDQIVQQVYLNPAASASTVQLDLTPGVLVAPQFARALDTDADGALGTAEIDAHVQAVQSAVTAQVDGRSVGLTLTEHRYPPLDLLAAGGGTITLVWAVPLPAGAQQVRFTDRYQPGGRTTVQMSVLVASDPIPLGAISHADGGRSMAVALNGATAGSSPDVPAVTDPAASGGSSMLDALRRPLTSPWALLVLLGVCIVLGALHALTPGHGKSLLAGYLVGARGTPGQAVLLGLVTTLTHTAAVLGVGATVLVAGSYVVPGVLVPTLTLVAGCVVLVLGLRLVRARWAVARAPDHHHGHGHDHDHHHGRQLLTRPSLRNVAAAGVTAGMIPCPEALGVLLLAVALHRVALGLVMIVAFSVGLAAVLVGLGLALVTAGPTVSRFTDRVPGWVTTRLPLISALVVAILGGVMTGSALISLAG
jgi:nickel/cobalt exporter